MRLAKRAGARARALLRPTNASSTSVVYNAQRRTAEPRQNTVICRSLWKIYGPNAKEILAIAQQERLTKKDVLARFKSVVGVANVSFNVERGEVFCVMGLSGSGKSTLVRHINRLIDPTSGDIIIEGIDINKLDNKKLRELRSSKIGMVFQNVALFPHRTVRDNVAYGLEIRGVSRKSRHETAGRVIELVQLCGWEERYPDELSGGMQQRVGLARALAVDPDILLLDEPFGALDPLIRRQLQSEFLHLSRTVKKTTIFITHDFDEAVRLGDRIAIMRDGAFAQVGTPEEIILTPADEYVAEFVQGVSRLQFVHARSIMIPIHGSSFETVDWPRAGANSSIDDLVDIAVKSTTPILIVAETGDAVGMITKDEILQSIKGGLDQRQRCTGEEG